MKMSTLKLNRRNWKKCLASIDILAIRQEEPTNNPYILEIAFFRKPKKEDSDLLERFHEEVLDCQRAGIFILITVRLSLLINKVNLLLNQKIKLKTSLMNCLKFFHDKVFLGLFQKHRSF